MIAMPPLFVDRFVELVEIQHCSFESELPQARWQLFAAT